MDEVYWFLGNETEINATNLTASNYSSCRGAAKLKTEWVLKAFGQCIETPLEYVAFFIGLSSILCWLVAQAPQLVTNCRLGIADKALSFWFLLQWFLGDATNLIGALLTHQLASQTITAVYFCMIDSVMMAQFFYYVIKNQGLRGLPNIFRCPTNQPGKKAAIFLPGLVCLALLSSWPQLSLFLSSSSSSSSSSDSIRTGRVLLSLRDAGSSSAPDWNDKMFLIGYIFGCVSALFYLGSRLPQIVQNFARCSVTGVSLPMFILAVMGNVTYSLGIFLYSVDGNFLIAKLPWIVGSIGTLCFDFTIFVQFLVYDCLVKRFHGDKKPGDDSEEAESEEEDERTPLLSQSNNKTEDTNLPCFSTKGNVQAHSRDDGYVSCYVRD